MKRENSYPQQIKIGYCAVLTVKNILNKGSVEFVLCHPEMDEDLTSLIAEVSGFNSNHPRYIDLIHQIKCTFTLDEISQFIGCLGSLDVLDLTIAVASYKVSDPVVPKMGQVEISVSREIKMFDFSTVEGYALPFVIKGIYNPTHS